MLNMLNEKIDYSKDPEGSISLGMKLLKKLEKDGWKDSDIYDEVEEIIITADVKHPKQMALRLKRTLENYDMWEAPYKGIVNKIQKWQFINESTELDDNLYYDKFDKRIKFEFYIEPRCYKAIYNKLLSGDYINDVKLIHEDDNYLEISVPASEYNNVVKFGNKMIDNQFIDDFNLVESVKSDKKAKLNEAESESNISYYEEVYGIIDQLVYKYKEWSLKDIQDQLDNGDIWFEDVMGKMNIDMNDLSDDEDAELCNIIINAMQNYLDDKDYFGQLHENSYQSDFADKFAYDKYYRPRDIQELMQKSKQRGVQLSRFEHWVLEAALWARARNNNYLGYSKEIPAVQYKNGKFYAQTIHDGMTEVPYNYNVMTPEWLFQK